ncbi:MAG: hypothetical protein HYZ72_02810 [Deltaproteobacteria bacterium]|nr:hypothetical protein [Deltaproteobacteria bacterium]
MKFMLQLVPTVPASPVERERLRPIAHRTEKIQQMLDEMVELAQGEEADGAVRGDLGPGGLCRCMR